MKKAAALFLYFLVCYSPQSHAQATSGIGEVTSIEAKAKMYQDYQKRLDILNSDLANLQYNNTLKWQDLSKEVDSMKRKRDIEIGELKLGYRCSQCKVLKSEMEKKGENFEAHLKQVNGVPVPAGDDEIAAKRQAWVEKIALRTVQLNQLRAKLLEAENTKKADIAKIKTLIEKICPEMRALSNTYETHVAAEGKRIQSAWIENAMSAVATQHIIEDKIFIAAGKIETAEKEFREKETVLREKLKTENDEKIKKLKEINLQTEEQIKILVQEEQLKEAEINERLSPKKIELADLEKKLAGKLSDSLSKVYKTAMVPVRAEIAALVKQLQLTQGLYADKIKEKKLSIKKANDESWSLTINLGKLQDTEVLKLKKIYDDRIAQQKLIKADNEKKLPVAHTRFLTLANEARNKLTDFVTIIRRENGRIITAADIPKCGIWTRAETIVSSNFNDEASCMEGLRNRNRSYPSTSMDCAGQSKGYMSVYRSFITGLLPEEIRYIKANTGSYWYTTIF